MIYYLINFHLENIDKLKYPTLIVSIWHHLTG